MGMSIDDAVMQLSMQKFYVLGKDYEAVQVAIDTMRKYQKIEEIINGWSRYRKGVSSSEGDSVYMQKVSEVVEDGKTD